MQNWRNIRNFRKFENADGTFTYIIIVDGVKVDVSREIYEAYASGGYKIENIELGIKRDRILKDANGKAVRDEQGCAITLPEREVSLDKLIDEDWDFPAEEPSPEDAFLNSKDLEIAELHRCIGLLDEDERALIKALFFEGMTEQGYATQLGIKQQNVNKRKRRIIKKIKNIWSGGC